jgi:hypothetical protein
VLIPAELIPGEYGYDASDTVDVGLLAVPRNTQRLLATIRELRPFRIDEAYPTPTKGEPEGNFVVGYPRELVVQTPTPRPRAARAGFVSAPVVIPCRLVTDARQRWTSTGNKFWRRSDCFYFSVSTNGFRDEGDLSDIDGVSGGPLVVVTRDASGELRDYLLGVQSSWLPDSRCVRVEQISKWVIGFLKHQRL